MLEQNEKGNNLPSVSSIKRNLFRLGCLSSLLLLAACNASMQNSMLGVQETSVGEHWVKVTDCYRTDKAKPEVREEIPGVVVHRYAPCPDAILEIRDEMLIVNGKSYGRLNKGDGVTVDHGKVLINDSEAREVAAK